MDIIRIKPLINLHPQYMKLIALAIFLSANTLSIGQVVLTLDSSEIYRRCEVFFRYLDGVEFKEANPSQVSKYEKKLLNYNSNKSEKIADFEMRSYNLLPINIHNLRVSGNVYTIKKSGNPYFKKIQFELFEFNDSASGVSKHLVNKFKNKQILSHPSAVIDSAHGTFTYLYLDSIDNQYFRNISTSLNYNDLIAEYGNSFFYSRFRRKSYDVPDEDIFFDLRDIIKQRNFLAMNKLLKTKSIIFNWFVAEELYYYNTLNPFLSEELTIEIKNIMRVKPFRDINRLKQLYETL